MKKVLKVFIPLLLVCTLTVALFSVIPSGAATTAEATLTVKPEGSAATTVSGSFQDMLERLSTVEPTVNTTYEIKLTSDAVHNEAVKIGGNAFTAVKINLNGYKLHSVADAPILYVGGELASVTVEGGFDVQGNRGQVICDKSCGALIFVERNNDTKNINTAVKNVSLVYSDLSKGYCDGTLEGAGQAMLDVRGGKLLISNSEFMYTGDRATVYVGSGDTTDLPIVGGSASGGELTEGDFSTVQLPLINVENATLTVKDTAVTSSCTNGSVIKAIEIENSKAVIINSSFDATHGIFVGEALDPSYVTVIDSSVTATDYPLYFSRTNTEINVIGSVITSKTATLANSNAGSDNLSLWYGNGETLICQSTAPSGFLKQDGTTLSEKSAGVWALNYSSSAEAMLTVAYAEGLPSVYVGSLDELMAKATGDFSASPLSEDTVFVVALLKDAALKPASVTSTNAYHNIIFDANGFDVTLSGEGHVFEFKGSPYVKIDGKGAGDDISRITSIANSQSLVYASATDGSNQSAVTRIENLELYYTALAESERVLYYLAGENYLSNVSITYTGANGPAAATAKNLIEVGNASHHKTPTLFLRGITLTDTNTNGIYTTALHAAASARVFAYGSRFNGAYYGISTQDTASVILNECKVSTDKAAYVGSEGGTVRIYDTETTTPTGALTLNGNENIIFCYGTGKNVVYVNAGVSLDGTYGADSGYIFYPEKSGEYRMYEGALKSTLSLSTLFADGMVFQRDENINVFGYCEREGATIECKMDGQTAHATVENGRWCATFEPIGAKFGLTLTVQELNCLTPKIFTFKNVNIGEVLVIAGQSNAQLQACYLEDNQEYYDNADNFSNVRLYTTDWGYKVVENYYGNGKWYEMSSSVLMDKGNVSGIMYVAAARLAAEFGEDVPIAVINTCQSASTIAGWVPYEEMEALRTADLSSYNLTQSEINMVLNGNSSKLPGVIKSLRYADNLRKYYEAYGKHYPSNDTDKANYKALTGESVPERPDKVSAGSIFYDRFVHLEGYNAKAIVWYQGCGDAGRANVNTYPVFFDAMQRGYAKVFGGGELLPTVVIQLAPYGVSSSEINDLTAFKDMQLKMCEERDNLYLVSTSDGGSPFGANDLAQGPGPSFIHPSRKSIVGMRVANILLENVYGTKTAEVMNAPKLISATKNGATVTLTFDTDLYYTFSNEALGFELYQSGSWYKAKGKIEGNKIILTADGVTAASGVRYAYSYSYIQLRDGTLIEYNSSSYGASNGNTDIGYSYIKDTVTGKVYRINHNEMDAVKNFCFGNITNESGEALPTFTATIQ